MSTRPLALILPIIALPALATCGPAGTPVPPPVSQAALAAVAAHPGVSRENLARRIDALFADDEAGETRALLVLHGGRLVAERYAPGYDRQTRFQGWSMTQS